MGPYYTMAILTCIPGSDTAIECPEGAEGEFQMIYDEIFNLQAYLKVDSIVRLSVAKG